MVAEDGVSELQSEGETVQKEDDMPVKRDDLQPKEEDEAEAIPDVKSLKKFIFKKERQVQSKEMSKGDDDASEELAIGGYPRRQIVKEIHFQKGEAGAK